MTEQPTALDVPTIDWVASLTAQRDEALRRLEQAALINREQLLAFARLAAENERVVRQRDISRETVATLERINIGLHDDLERMEEKHRDLLAEYQAHLAALRLAADQQHAGEPDDPHTWDRLRAAADAGAETIAGLCAFLDPAPTTTRHGIPLRALTHQKQAVGLLR